MRKIINFLRNITPLYLRKIAGPIFAYIYYVYKVYIQRSPIPHVLSIEETIDTVIAKNLSMIRLGDGEMSIIEKITIPFQDYSDELRRDLIKILQSDLDGLLICVPGIFGKMTIFVKEAFLFNIHHLFKHGYMWEKLLSVNKTYGNTFVGRAYIYLSDRSRSGIIFKKLQSLWEGKNVVLIEGAKSRNGVGNGLFDNTASVTRIPCPNENAYEQIDTILKEVRNSNKDSLILLALGPAAKVIAYTLFQEGYRVIDIGHLDMEYEMFVKGDVNAHKKRLIHKELKRANVTAE